MRLLADGATHSGTQLAAELGLTRAAVWKRIRQLDELGLQVQAQAGSGYRLAQPLELLDAEQILAACQPAVRSSLAALTLHWSLPSTNDYLLEQADAAAAAVCLAEHQSGGRGRRGRRWLTPAGHGICLSLAWPFAEAPAQLHCLGLAVGTAVLEALRHCGVPGVQLKWPNDVMAGDAKLAGILIDVQGEADGPLRAVIGIGLNFYPAAALAAAVREAGGLPPAAVAELAPDVSRNALVAALLNALVNRLAAYPQQGFAGSIADWRDADYLRGRAVSVTGARGVQTGTARGIAADGQLQLDTASGLIELLSGDVSVRPTS